MLGLAVAFEQITNFQTFVLTFFLQVKTSISSLLPMDLVPQSTPPVRDRSIVVSMHERQQADRIEKIASEIAASPSSPEWHRRDKLIKSWNRLRSILSAITPAFSLGIRCFNIFGPYIVTGFSGLCRIYAGLSSNMSTALYGLALSFFGGTFPVAIAVGEAFRVSGGDRVVACLTDINVDFQLLLKANEEDDKKDEDKDGTLDVDQIDSKALLSRKIHLFMVTVNPDRLMHAIGGLSQAMAGAVAVAKLEFARTIALAVSISDNIQKPAALITTPILARLLPAEYHKWIQPLVTTGCRLASMSIAWYIQRILSTVHSSMLGGLIAGRALIRLLNDYRILRVDVDRSIIDETLGWVITLGGMYFQFSNNFRLPFPLNLILLPLSLIDYILQWVITWQ